MYKFWTSVIKAYIFPKTLCKNRSNFQTLRRFLKLVCMLAEASEYLLSKFNAIK